MLIDVPGAGIREVVSIIPETQVSFVETAAQYGIPKSKAFKMKEVFGFDKRRVAAPHETALDFASYGLHTLLDTGLNLTDIGAIIFVGQTPDHFMPGNSYILHGRFDFSVDTLCLDINQGCNGFIYGLFLSYQLVNSLGGKEALLINGDTLSHRVSAKDHKIQPLIGDATTLCRIGPDPAGIGKFLIRSDGNRASMLTIPAGGARMPLGLDEKVLVRSADGCERAAEHFTMDGSGVFSFTQTNVPGLIRDIMNETQTSLETLDKFFFHQPNIFLIRKLAEALSIPIERVPHDTVNEFGNQSGASIPHTICMENVKTPFTSSHLCCLAGFGVGLSWGSAITRIGPLKRAEILIKPLLAESQTAVADL